MSVTRSPVLRPWQIYQLQTARGNHLLWAPHSGNVFANAQKHSRSCEKFLVIYIRPTELWMFQLNIPQRRNLEKRGLSSLMSQFASTYALQLYPVRIEARSRSRMMGTEKDFLTCVTVLEHLHASPAFRGAIVLFLSVGQNNVKKTPC